MTREWTAGFYAGVLSALAVIGEESTTYEEIVRCVGGDRLLRAARKEDDIELPRIRSVVRELKRRRAGTQGERP